MFTNVSLGSPKQGDTLSYSLRGNLGTMAIHDEKSGSNDDGPVSDFTVAWDTVEGEGKMVKDAQASCWDTLAKGQVDIACPGGEWPTP